MKNPYKFIFLLALLAAICCTSKASAQILWMQQPAISPDGKWIAFEYKSNIYKVSANGGSAIQLTANSYYNGYPRWSKDGSQLAFASDRYGNFDVFVMSSQGGKVTRLTYASTRDIPREFSNDGKLVYYQTNAHDVYTSVRFPDDDYWQKLYAVPATGGRSVMINSAGTEFASFNKTGDKLLFQDRKGLERPERKHHISSATRDIWCFDVKQNKYEKLTDFEGEDREPVWGDGNHFYFLSERKGNQNIFSSTLDAPGKVNQLTNFEKNPVRNLSRSDNGLLAFTQNGELFTLEDGGSPKKVEITINADFADEKIENIKVNDGGDEMAVSPNGKEIAFVFQGDIFVTSTAGIFTKQITNTPQRERMVNFSPDGRTILYSVENAGSWDIYKATIADAGEPYFYGAAKIDIQPVVATPKDEYQGIFSPDGTRVAYLEERKVLKVYNTITQKTITLMPQGYNFSFVDGDLTFSWSPDGKYIVMQSEYGLQGRIGMALVKADGTEKSVNITNSAYLSLYPHWGGSGKMIYYQSGKEEAGNGLHDIYAMFFDRAAFKNYTKTEIDPQLQAERKKLDSALHRSEKDTHQVQASPAFTPNLINLEDRTIRLTPSSTRLGGFLLSPDEYNLYTLSTIGGNAGLYVTNQHTHSSKLLTKLDNGYGQMIMSKDGKWIYLLSSGKISKINTEDGSATPITINGNRTLNKADQRAYILQHVHNLMQKKFYDPDLGGVDWDYYYHNYSRFLNDINNNYDFTTLVSELIGELNSSHTGMGMRASGEGDKTAALGLLYDLSQANEGLKVTAILRDGPFDNPETNLKPGDIIDEIDGNPVKSDEDWAKLLNLKTGKNIAVAFYDPASKKRYNEYVTPISSADETETLLYKRWVRKMEHLTDSLSHGTIAYIHIRQMDDENLHEAYEGAVGRATGKKAVIIDTRYNPGGNIHKELMDFITGTKFSINSRPQSAKLADEGNTEALNKPTCVIVSEGNYSDGYNFPFLYQLRKAGKLIGMPVAGTGTGVWYENQIDPTLYVGIPGIGLSVADGDQSLLENHQITPDILVRDDYSQILNGRDQQLEAAVNELLQEIKK